MSNVFNAGRFGKYFAYDIPSRWKDQRAFILTSALLPVIFYLVFMFFSMLGTGLRNIAEGTPVTRPELGIRIGILFITSLLFLMLYPSRAYGFITEKARGSAWIELPASRLEKFISMMLVCLILVPVFFFAVYLLGDALVCLVDNQCGSSIFGAWLGNDAREMVRFGGSADSGEVILGGNGFWMIASGVLQLTSVFLLGALIFKKMKVTKTVLSLFILSMVLSLIMVTVLKSVDTNALGDRMQAWMFNHADNFDLWINFWSNIELAIVVIGCGIWSWFRVKNVQH